MPKVHREATVPFTTQQMYELVSSIESYPQFVSTCVAGDVLHEGQNFVHARLSFEKGPMKQCFTTKNTLYPYEKIDMELLEGPFSRLSGGWVFSPVYKGSKIELHLDFDFDNRMLKMILQPVFEQISLKMLQSFCNRAEKVYGQYAC